MDEKKKEFSRKKLKLLGLIFLEIAVVFFLGYKIGKTVNEKTGQQIKTNFPTKKPPSLKASFPYPSYPFLGLNHYEPMTDWKEYIFEVGYRQKEGEITLKLPPGMKTSEESIVEPMKTLVIKKGNSKLYLGEPKIFSTNTGLYCINCQTIGQLKVKILGKIKEIPIVQDLNNETSRFITKFNLPLEPCQDCWYDASIIAFSLDDFFQLLQIAETIEFNPSNSIKDETIDWHLHKSEAMGFSIKHPRNWQVSSERVISTRREMGVGKVTITIGVYYDQNEERELTKEEVISSLFFGDISEKAKTTIDKVEATRIKIKKGKDNYEEVVVFQKGKNIYTLQMDFSPGRKEKSKTFDLMLSTFRFL